MKLHRFLDRQNIQATEDLLIFRYEKQRTLNRLMNWDHIRQREANTNE